MDEMNTTVKGKDDKDSPHVNFDHSSSQQLLSRAFQRYFTCTSIIVRSFTLGATLIFLTCLHCPIGQGAHFNKTRFMLEGSSSRPRLSYIFIISLPRLFSLQNLQLFKCLFSLPLFQDIPSYSSFIVPVWQYMSNLITKQPFHLRPPILYKQAIPASFIRTLFLLQLANRLYCLTVSPLLLTICLCLFFL